jgi:signal transduction histidine kinase
MRKLSMPPLSLRYKILIILVCYVCGILAMSVVSQKDLFTAKEKLEAVELSYSLNTIILEVRRYEKNFLLYSTEDALVENQNQLTKSLETVDTILNRVRSRFKAYPMLLKLKALLLEYQESMSLMAKEFRQYNTVSHGPLVETVRLKGQEMTVLSEELVSFEHLQILTILNALVEQLIIWSLVAITVGIFMPLIMSFKIFKPLGIIKAATEDIALGRFRKIEVLDTRDEMQQVMEAFNTMVGELERRQDQLVQSQKLSSIGTLTAGIAHQLNNPLNNISTSCQIAQDEFGSGDPEVMRRMLRNIEQETYRARDVVQGLLEFSRVREFSLRFVNLRDTVDRAVKLVKSHVPALITITVDVPADLFLPMDSQRLQEVILNMLINATQAITGEGQITISCRVDQADDVVILTIHDTGIGIPDAIKARLFDPFYTTKEEGQGTGLGLSIAYGIIQQHNGRITVDSTAGEGASFHIHLPLQFPKEGV